MTADHYPMPLSLLSPAHRAAYWSLVLLALGVWLLPLIGIAITSMRSIADLRAGNFWGWPTTFAWQNYFEIFGATPLFIFILNSFMITVSAVLGTIALSSMSGYALAKFDLPGSNVLLGIFVAGNFVPHQMLMIPVRAMVNQLGLYDMRAGLVLFHIAFQTGFATLFMRNFMRQVPDTLIDTARIDGIAEIKILLNIVLPLAKPAMAGVAVLVFTFVWNDYFWSLNLVQSDAVRPVTAGIQTLRAMWITSWNWLAAGSIIAALPPVTLFFFMQRHFVTGLTAGIR
jgi:multiple sugar transport system permease protein